MQTTIKVIKKYKHSSYKYRKQLRTMKRNEKK